MTTHEPKNYGAVVLIPHEVIHGDSESKHEGLLRRTMIPADYLKLPYSRVIIPDVETSTYTAYILEFPGCVVQGMSPGGAYWNLERTAVDWIAVSLELGQAIPEPTAEGRL